MRCPIQGVLIDFEIGYVFFLLPIQAVVNHVVEVVVHAVLVHDGSPLGNLLVVVDIFLEVEVVWRCRHCFR